VYANLSTAQVCTLYALSNLQDEQWSAVPSVQGVGLRFVKQAVAAILDSLRPDAVALVDAFDFPDRVLASTIGRHDGNVYEALYEAAKKSPLNQVDPFEGYEKVLRPRLDIDFIKDNCNKPFLSNL